MKNIFVGNLSFGVTEASVRSLFETHGTVDRVNICTDRDSGQPRGFGFVEMANDGEAEKAIAAVNGRELDGRALNVNEARPKADRPGGGGGVEGVDVSSFSYSYYFFLPCAATASIAALTFSGSPR